MGPDAMIFIFWMLSLKPTFSLSSFTYIKRLFSLGPHFVIHKKALCRLQNHLGFRRLLLSKDSGSSNSSWSLVLHVKVKVSRVLEPPPESGRLKDRTQGEHSVHWGPSLTSFSGSTGHSADIGVGNQRQTSFFFNSHLELPRYFLLQLAFKFSRGS